ncbi:NACHT and WD repeat domain-containing protein 2 [Caerostris extrusa]|uniref:NACHT and WD repeat domain-containing protein 2 n=1 Tax=Caerostris extrusa TaxID=172846 RepID=A0AAV4MLT7_CAEEX|nr:NACHT and WD repeat domain-containing protein 2 [Caerostris extrusa]
MSASEQRTVGHESNLEAVKSYLVGNANHPLIIQGPTGCGKTCLMAKLTELSSVWFPTACVVSRLVSLTAESATQHQLLRSISEQCCALYGNTQLLHHLWDYGLGKLLGKVSELRPLIILIDGIDQLADYSNADLQWLPRELPAHVKLIMTVRDNSDELEKIKDIMEESDCFLSVSNPTAEDAKASITQVLESICARSTTSLRAKSNKRKLEELPYQVLQVNDSIRDNFLFDATWLLYKFCGSDPYQLLEDISTYQKTLPKSDIQLELLENVVQLSSYALRSDGSQFFAQMYGRLKKAFSTNACSVPFNKSLYDSSCKPPLSSLLPIGTCLEEPLIPNLTNNCNNSNHHSSPGSESPSSRGFPFTGLYTIKEDKCHVVSISSDRNEIVVWNIYEQAAVRRMTGINQPKDIKMIDIYRAF